MAWVDALWPRSGDDAKPSSITEEQLGPEKSISPGPKAEPEWGDNIPQGWGTKGLLGFIGLNTPVPVGLAAKGFATAAETERANKELAALGLDHKLGFKEFMLSMLPFGPGIRDRAIEAALGATAGAMQKGWGVGEDLVADAMPSVNLGYFSKTGQSPAQPNFWSTNPVRSAPVAVEQSELGNFSTPQSVAAGYDMSQVGLENPSEGHDSTTSGSMCFITTAVVDAMGLDDNCYWLNVLRNYRDERLQGDPRVKEYYAVAPKVVAAIKALPDGEKIFRNFFWKYIVRIVGRIECMRFEEAEKLYEELFAEAKSYAGL